MTVPSVKIRTNTAKPGNMEFCFHTDEEVNEFAHMIGDLYTKYWHDKNEQQGKA